MYLQLFLVLRSAALPPRLIVSFQPSMQRDVHQSWLGHSSHGWDGKGAAGFHPQSPQTIWDSSDLPEHLINPILYTMQSVAWAEVTTP